MVPDVRVRQVAVVAALFAVVSLSPVAAQESLPACDPGVAPSECRLPIWPGATQIDAPSAFGPIDGWAWVEDPAGDAPPSGLDILAVGVGGVDVADAKAIRDLPELLKAGKVKQAVRPGENVLVRVVLDRPLDVIEDGHAGVHVATDIDRSRSNNAPAAAGGGEQPFAGSEDVYSVTYASTTGNVELLDSDLSRAWYRDKDAFAAAWAGPTILDVLVRPEAMGDGLRVVAFSSGEDGGYDSVTLGPGPIPVDGEVGMRPSCLEASIVTEPFVVRRLRQGGQTLRNVETPASWRGGAAFALDAEARRALEALVAAGDEDGDGRIGLGASVDLFEDGTVMAQIPEFGFTVEGDTAQLSLELGLTRRGYEVLRAIELEPTGNGAADAWLARATDAMVQAMPPFRSGKRGGLLLGEVIGACVPGLIEPVGPADDPGADAEGAPDS